MSPPANAADANSRGGAGHAAPVDGVAAPLGPDREAPPRAGFLAWWTLSASRMRLLALLSALSTGLVIWAGLGGEGSSRLAAALAHRRSLLARAAAASSGAAQPAPSAAVTPASGGSPESTPSASADAGGKSQPAAAAASAPQASATPARETSPTTPSPAGERPPATTPAAPSKAAEAKIDHVFVITLQSPGYEQTWGPASPARYLTTQLRPRGALLSSYYAVAHLDLPNYIAMVSGQPPNTQTSADCTTVAEFPAASKVDAAGRLQAPGCLYPVNVLTLGDQLTSTRRQWRGYIEDLGNGPKPVQSCRHLVAGQPDETQRARPGDAYAARHNPFVYFHSLLDLGDCASDDLPLTQLTTDLASVATTPNYAFIAPNLCHDGSEPVCPDGSPGGLAAADAFLAQWVPKILASPAYVRDGLLVITFADGPASDTGGCCVSSIAGAAAGGGRVGALLLSRYVTPGAESKTPYDHYSLLRTVEDIFGLAHLANAGQAGVTSFSADVLKSAFAKRR